MKKILFMINSYGGGGAEKLLLDIVKNISSDKYDITICTFSDKGIYANKFPEYVHKKELVHTNNKILSWVLIHLLAFVLSPKFVYKYFIKDNYDVEVAFLEGPMTRILSGSNNSSAKKIAWVHFDLFHNFATRRLFLTTKRQNSCYKVFDKVVCVSEVIKDNFVRRFSDTGNLDVLYNFIDEDDIKQKLLSNKWDYKGERPLLISVGRLIKEKGYERLLLVYQKLKAKGKVFHAVILGTGPLYGTLKRMIDSMQLNNTVELLGFQNNPYIYMKQADLFVLPSLVEGYGLVLAEAMYIGISVLSTKCAGPENILEGGKYGCLVDNTEEGLYKGIKRLLESVELREEYREKGKKRVDFFSKKKRVLEIENLLDGE